MPLGISTYSYWHFQGAPHPPERVLEAAARLGVTGVEVLEMQLGEDAGTPRLHALRRQALTLGLDLYGLATHQDFVSPDAQARAAQVRRTERSLQVAAELGAGCIRVNSGRWKTIPDFTAFMAAGGVEPPLPGWTQDDAFGWVQGCLERLLPAAERAGVVLALENHWGLTANASGVLRLLDALPSPWLAAVADTGNYLGGAPDRYAQLAALAARAVLVHAKSYIGGGVWYDLETDFNRVGRILSAAGYRGYVSLEFEGRADPETAVAQALAELRHGLAGGA